MGESEGGSLIHTRLLGEQFDFGASAKGSKPLLNLHPLNSSRRHVPQCGRIQRFNVERCACWIPYRHYPCLAGLGESSVQDYRATTP
jgi:hypothetical protein